MSSRLPPVLGEWIDRSQSLTIRFDGQRYAGHPGDVVSSALWAAGVRVLGRSFKYHRPRGILSLANHDVNTLMTDDAHINLRGDVSPLAEGMDLRAVNTAGGARADRRRLFDKLSAFMPVGFYYKAFHRPKALAHFWERFFRRMAGLGEINVDSPRLYTPKRYDFRDLLVIGAGPSGLAAGLCAAHSGASVLIVEENAQAGGSLGYARGGSDTNHERLEELLAQAKQLPHLEIRTGTCAVGYYADHWIALVEAQRMTTLRARAVIVSTGVMDQPAVFRNNDAPGVMFASAAQRLIYRYAVKPMHRAVVLTANSEGYEAALDLDRHGIGVGAVLDLRPEGESTDLAQRVTSANIRVLKGYGVSEAIARNDRLTGVRIFSVDGQARLPIPNSEVLSCDGLLMSVGFAPAAALLYQAGARMSYSEITHQFYPRELPKGVFAAGRVNGVFDLPYRLEDGKRAAQEAVRYLGFSTQPNPIVPPQRRWPTHPYPIFAHPDGKNFVDFDEDLQLKDFANAAQEGFDNIELMKRYSTVGMGPSQGKHSNMNAIRILANLRGETVDKVGTTTSRPFYHPVALAHLSGRGFHPVRRTPLHSLHAELGAAWMPAGNWQRPEYYARSDQDKNECVRGEVRAVRESLGLIDVGTLGKMDLYGPAAGEFLERVYAGRCANLKVGMTRYGVMLDESGVIIDDGVMARLSDQHFYFTTTTTGSATVYRELTRWNTLWRMDCGIVNLTGAFSAMNLAGPKARDLLAKLTDLDLSHASFPYLGVREAQVADVPCRLLRVGFVGELGYEIHTPAEHAHHLWTALMAAGNALGIRPFGVEAQRLLRLEKGHIIIGQDTDGLTTPLEARMEWAIKMDKPFFVGQRSLRIVAPRQRKQVLVGFTLDKSHSGAVPKECHLIIRGNDIAGRVTSIAFSETLGCHIGLAFIIPELAEEGTAFAIRADAGKMVSAVVAKAPFYDPSAQRQRDY